VCVCSPCIGRSLIKITSLQLGRKEDRETRQKAGTYSLNDGCSKISDGDIGDGESEDGLSVVREFAVVASIG
jgi:hypothetical protein